MSLGVKRYRLLENLPLDKYRNAGLPEDVLKSETIVTKYQAYLAEVLEFVKEHNDYTDLEDEDAKLNLKDDIIYPEKLRDELAATLIVDLKTIPEIRKALITYPSIWEILSQVLNNNYEKEKAHFFEYVNMHTASDNQISDEEKTYMIQALEHATEPYDYESMGSVREKDKRLAAIIDKIKDDMDFTDFDYRILRNKRLFKKVFTNEETQAIFQEVLSCVTEEQFAELERRIRGTKNDLLNFASQRGQDLFAQVKKQREFMSGSDGTLF